MKRVSDLIPPAMAGTLPGLFRERVRRSPEGCAYLRLSAQERCCERISWQEAAQLAGRWQEALRREGLQPGDRVALMLKNSLEWILFDLAALGLGLITVPVYVNDRPENLAAILAETEARLLLIEGATQWAAIRPVHERLAGLRRIVALTPFAAEPAEPRLMPLAVWLPESGAGYDPGAGEAEALATIVYTSGTTGNPKGVMLSHASILANVHASLEQVPVYPDDLFLSFLPLSHTLERTAGYYVPIMAGASVAHVRSLERLNDDLILVRPTVIIAVPLFFERVHHRLTQRLEGVPGWKQRLFALAVEIGWQRFLCGQQRTSWSLRLLLWPLLESLVAGQFRAALGGRTRMAVSGGAPLSPEIAREFIALGLPILQGYGLAEASPVVSVNTLEDNRPETVGRPLGNLEVAIGAQSELLVRGPNVMRGYWRNPTATAAAIDGAGWLHTGDQARIEPGGQIVITGRLKEIIVMANGEKVSPADLEMAIAADRLFAQTMVVGEGQPYLAALVVLDPGAWGSLATTLGIDPGAADALERAEVAAALLERIAPRLAHFPGYARIRRVHAILSPWTEEEGLLTATRKLRRTQVQARHADDLERLYA